MNNDLHNEIKHFDFKKHKGMHTVSWVVLGLYVAALFVFLIQGWWWMIIKIF